MQTKACRCLPVICLFLMTFARTAVGFLPSHAEEFELTGAKYDHVQSPARFPKWTSMLQRARDQRLNGTPTSVLSDWFSMLDSVRSDNEAEQIEAVNRYVSGVPYRSDLDNYGVLDWWATPAEFFNGNGGDCEDYAIAKYMSFRELGRSPEKIRIVVVWDEERRTHHAILEYEREGRSVLLGNVHPNPYRWSDVPNYHPIFALNEQSYWIFDALQQPQYIAHRNTRHGAVMPAGP